jgi:ABC-type xylose transport system permease subunit
VDLPSSAHPVRRYVLAIGGNPEAAHGALDGSVIGGIYNGRWLRGLQLRWAFVVTGLVPVAAVTIDSLSRRGGAGRI